MSRDRGLVNLRRCARGLTLNLGTAHHTTLQLYNNSNSAELLLLWQVLPISTGEPNCFVGYNQIPVFAGATAGACMMPGDALPPGLLASGDTLALLPFDSALTPTSIAFAWPATFPLAVLPPGWSLTFQNATLATGGIGLAFVWEAMLPARFHALYAYEGWLCEDD